MVSLAIHQVSNTVDVNSRNIYFLHLPPDKQNFSVQRLLVQNHLAVRHFAYTNCSCHGSATSLLVNACLCAVCVRQMSIAKMLFDQKL
jgi:hypothetical protein